METVLVIIQYCNLKSDAVLICSPYANIKIKVKLKIKYNKKKKCMEKKKNGFPKK